MQTMDADLARLVRSGRITRGLAEQRASVPEELKRLLGGAPPVMPAGPLQGRAADEAAAVAAAVSTQPPTAVPPTGYGQGG
jgi:hypothetical protein